MPLKDYQVRVEKEFFFPMDSTIVITAGETSSLTFKMKSTIKPKEPRRTLVMLEAGWHPSQTSFGAMVGFVAKMVPTFVSAVTLVPFLPIWNVTIREH